MNGSVDCQPHHENVNLNAFCMATDDDFEREKSAHTHPPKMNVKPLGSDDTNIS